MIPTPQGPLNSTSLNQMYPRRKGKSLYDQPDRDHSVLHCSHVDASVGKNPTSDPGHDRPKTALWLMDIYITPEAGIIALTLRPILHNMLAFSLLAATLFRMALSIGAKVHRIPVQQAYTTREPSDIRGYAGQQVLKD
ncbi:hypothetical protein RhiJN_03692 [Ceratobasidium sp. AG-Ba]|nr:hypothetical protein RhiJN_03692 [Ceratobasidium sp. AG-Ba]